MAGGGPGGGGGGGPSVPPPAFFARLSTATPGVSNTLTLLPYQGNTILVNGQSVTVPAIGLSRLVTDNLISAAGADSGSPPVANTLYYVYVANALASFSPTSIRLSATAPSLVNGVKYLGGAGNALNWRFVGWVMPNATPQFQNDQTNRSVVNYYNRIALDLFCAPAWVDSNTTGVLNMPQITWALLNGGTGDGFKWLGNGEDAVLVESVLATDSASSTFIYSGISINGNGPVNASVQDGLAAVDMPTDQLVEPQEGLVTADMWAFGPGGSEWYHDFPRNGLATGPKVSYMSAIIQG